MRFGLILLLTVTVTFGFVIPEPEPNSTQQTGKDLADYVNSVQSLFVAEYSEVQSLPKVMNSKYSTFKNHGEFPVRSTVLANLPTHFDSRDAWPSCKSIQLVRNQENCGACWAFGTAEIISDRICIQSKGAHQPIISPQDILTCCGSQCGNGCGGGYQTKALQWWITNGVVTGEDYGGAGCKPYSFPSCSTCSAAKTTPACSSSCQKGYSTKYAQDKHYGSTAFAVANNVAAIQTEIFANGPVSALYAVYDDFYLFKSGIYHHVKGNYSGNHVVKIIGWGTEKNVDYWLIANSWGTLWGDVGFFKMRRGTNECGIEAQVVAGEPRNSALSQTFLVGVLAMMAYYLF